MDDVYLLTRAVAEKRSRDEEPGVDDRDDVDGGGAGGDDATVAMSRTTKARRGIGTRTTRSA